MKRPLLALLCWLPLAATAAPDPWSGVRQEFVAALADAATRDPALDSDRLRSYPLYPWLEAERLELRLARSETPPDDAIAEFLVRDGDQPYNRDLRSAWLKVLADRQWWAQYLAFYLPARADTTLRCHALSALFATGSDPTFRDSALAVWRTDKDLPPACKPIVDWLRVAGALTPDVVAGRTRMALEAGKVPLARTLIAQLPEEQRTPWTLWADVIGEPRTNFEYGVRAGAEPKALADAFARLARADEDVAAATLARVEAACAAPCATLRTPATAGELRREVALNLAWSRRPETVPMFRMVPEPAIDERAHEWRIRAALWAGDWPQAEAWLAALPPALAQQQRWRYWRGRTAQVLGKLDAARADLEPLALENGYYPLLAAERLDRSYAPRPGVRPQDPATREALAQQAGFVRAREAFLVDQPAWARLEWNEATTGFEGPRLMEAARLAASWGWYLQAVAMATKAEVFDDFDLLYPRPYDREIADGAKRAGLPMEWLYAVLRQESLYDPRARSSADALGLLQLLPETARGVARRHDLPSPTREDLFDPPTNVQLGAAYLREQADTFGGRFILALGAYNAGPNAVRRWLPSTPMEADVWIENVPYNETRNYIQRIVWHTTVYGWKTQNKAQRVTALMAPIGIAPSTAAPGAGTVAPPGGG
ncbi:MAG TPA: transglycosylase SLT domain-containing protein [Nevskiaceae bacterium]|nr:transglycosylase SLT domain-containing protein [Nevskiaceae bacterium]